MPDIDWGQVVFLILFVVVGFVRWLGNLIQQQKEAKNRPLPSPAERALREAAWRKQTGQATTPVPASTQPPPDPFGEWKDLLKQFKESTQPTPPRTRPPPLQQRPQPQPSAPPPTPPPSAPFVTLSATHAFPTSSFVDRSFTEAIAHRDRRTADSLMRLRTDLRSPLALRRAIVIREILGPPKALAED
jgi:hypothetical protein